MDFQKRSQWETRPPTRAPRELLIPNPKLKLMDQVREVLRLKHYSLRTERSYCDWIRRYIHFHRMKSREDLFTAPEARIEEFLSDLAINGHVAASTQNQAFNGLLFLYRQVLHQDFGNVRAVRADRPVRVPVVLTAEEVKRVIWAMSGLPRLVVKLLYGSGLRLMEALRLRVQDLDFEMKQLTVRDTGKEQKTDLRYWPRSSSPACGSIWSTCASATRRTCGRASGRCTCPARWTANTPRPPGNGAGSTFSRHATYPWTRARA